MSAGVDADVDACNGICIDLYVGSAVVDVCIGICVASYVVSTCVSIDVYVLSYV